jgi:TrmH family RNA methyltransferase
MLTEEERRRVCVVLVRARNPANIGAVARAMHDFGFATLRVANEFAVPFEAAKSAVDASAVLENAASYTSVAEAVADCTLVLGTTAVGERDVQHRLRTLAEAAPEIRQELMHPTTSSDAEVKRPRVALLFGSEKTGLSNLELSHCNWLLSIPMHQHDGLRHPSMNLGQAAAVCLYELVRDSETLTVDPTISSVTEPADAGTLERLTALLIEVMEKTEYTRRHAANSTPEHVRRLVRRIGVDAVDAPVWMGILRQVLWKLGVRLD